MDAGVAYFNGVLMAMVPSSALEAVWGIFCGLFIALYLFAFAKRAECWRRLHGMVR